MVAESSGVHSAAYSAPCRTSGAHSSGFVSLIMRGARRTVAVELDLTKQLPCLSLPDPRFTQNYKSNHTVFTQSVSQSNHTQNYKSNYTHFKPYNSELRQRLALGAIAARTSRRNPIGAITGRRIAQSAWAPHRAASRLRLRRLRVRHSSTSGRHPRTRCRHSSPSSSCS